MTARMEVIEATRPIDPDLAGELEKQAAWISERVRDVRVAEDGRTVRFAVEGAGEIERERAKVARFVADMTERHRPLPRKTLAQRSRAEPRALVPDAYAELVRRKWVVETGPGRLALRGPALAVVRAIDEDAAHIAHERFAAADESHPSLVPAQMLAKCGWFASFPHTASFVTHLTEDYEGIERFRAANADAVDFVTPPPAALGRIDACLLPALCYPVYASREHEKLGQGGVTVTCRGTCFRYESRNLTGLERLWEFGMREVVFLGAEEAVTRSRAPDARTGSGAPSASSSCVCPSGRAKGEGCAPSHALASTSMIASSARHSRSRTTTASPLRAPASAGDSSAGCSPRSPSTASRQKDGLHG